MPNGSGMADCYHCSWNSEAGLCRLRNAEVGRSFSTRCRNFSYVGYRLPPADEAIRGPIFELEDIGFGGVAEVPWVNGKPMQFKYENVGEDLRLTITEENGNQMTFLSLDAYRRWTLTLVAT